MTDKRMTVEALVTLADLVAYASRKDSPEQMVCDAILSLLAEDAPCGWEAPSVHQAELESDGWEVRIPTSWAEWVSPDDARALARMLMRAADEADAKGGGK